MNSLVTWSTRRWTAAGIGAFATALLIGVPSDVIANPMFGRPVDVTWWSYPVLAATAVLGGLLFATYVRNEPSAAATPIGEALDDEPDRQAATAGVGGVLSLFAVGCPTCNKLVVLAVGTSGALDWFAPVQPMLAVTSLLVLGWALRARLQDGVACRVAV